MWRSVGEFLAMGGYGPYVWGSYGVTLLAMAAELIAVRRRRRSAVSQLRRFSEEERQSQ